jgi:Flp pilus assembly protein TadD
LPKAYWEGLVARWQGDVPRARAAFTVARTELEKAVAAEPNLASAVSLLGVMDAGLGRKEEAIRQGRRACELLPISKDAVDGPWIATNLAQILAWTGEKSAAIEQLETVARVPNILSYGFLKLQPMWDNLRGDPRFEKLVADLATKEF